METSGPFDIDDFGYVLTPDGSGLPRAVTADFYASLDRDFDGFRGHSLVQRFRFDEAWSTWEIHPRGDEFVLLLDGAADVVLWQANRENVIRVEKAGNYVVVPRNTWHTARPLDHADMLFITPGEGTLNAERPAS